jgi:hypothetical protein
VFLLVYSCVGLLKAKGFNVLISAASVMPCFSFSLSVRNICVWWNILTWRLLGCLILRVYKVFESLLRQVVTLEPSIQWIPGTLFPGLKQLRREPDHSPPCSTEVKNALDYTSTFPYVFMARCWIKHSDCACHIDCVVCYVVYMTMLSQLSKLFSVEWVHDCDWWIGTDVGGVGLCLV